MDGLRLDSRAGLLQGGGRGSALVAGRPENSLLLQAIQYTDNALQSIAACPSTTVAPQALHLLNNPHVRKWARNFARRIAPKPETPPDEAVKSGYRLALSRPPTNRELADSLAFLAQQTASYRAAGASDATERALADFCQVLMSLKRVRLRRVDRKEEFHARQHCHQKDRRYGGRGRLGSYGKIARRP